MPNVTQKKRERKAYERLKHEKINTSRGAGHAGHLEFVGRRILERHHRAVAGAEATLEHGGDAVEDFSGEGFCPNL
jgi:hypothetical protein